MKKEVYNNSALTALFVFTAGYISYTFRFIDNGSRYAFYVFLIAVTLVSCFTKGYLYGVISSVLGAVGVQLAAQYPDLHFDFFKAIYSLAFIVLLIVSLVICNFKRKLTEERQLNASIVNSVENEKMRFNLLRAVSHDIRTPLTGIIGSTDALIAQYDKISQEERQRLLADTKKDAEWLLRMVDNLLSVTRIEDDCVSVKKQPEAAEEIVGESVAKLKKHYDNCTINISVPEELLMIPMDAMLIEQVIINLLENACVHAETATEIKLSVSLNNNNAVFEISDNGVGIDEDKIEKLFNGESFCEQNNSDNLKKSNMGIGLSVCKAIIKAHGGTISAYNKQDGGATFEFTLPLEIKEKN